MKEIRQPWLVCRMSFDYEGGNDADNMGSVEFEWGSDSFQESQRRVFEKGFETAETTVVVDIEKYLSTTGKDEKRETKVFMIAGKGFDFSGYTLWLQKMANEEIRTKHSTGFYEQSRKIHGIVKENHLTLFSGIGIWFDTQNDVYWALTKEENDKLLANLQRIKDKWTKQGVFKTPSQFSR